MDGSQGEGGGQILRTAVTFSVIKKRAVKVVKIRAGRETPGLMRQHVSVLKVLADVFGGELEGAVEGSSTIKFAPRGQKRKAMNVDMGTAASITLVLQAVVPAAALGGTSLVLDLVGGTDVPWSPTFDYLDYVVRGAFETVGIFFDVRVARRGYYPRGGGRVSANVKEGGRIIGLNLTEDPEIHDVAVVSRCSSLPRHVADRQLSAAVSTLESEGLHVDKRETFVGEALSPGSSVIAYSVGNDRMLGGDSIGARGKGAGVVGEEAARRFIAAWKSGACLDSNVADMIVPLLSLALEPSKVRVQTVTPHLRSGLQLAEQFTSCKWAAVDSGASWLVNITPIRSDRDEQGHNV